MQCHIHTYRKHSILGVYSSSDQMRFVSVMDSKRFRSSWGVNGGHEKEFIDKLVFVKVKASPKNVSQIIELGHTNYDESE